MTANERVSATAARSPGRTPWAGWALALIGSVHIAATPMLYGDGTRSIIDAGVLASVEADPAVEDLRAAVFWYVTAGLAMLLLSFLVATLERSPNGVPASVGVSLLVIAAWGVLLMPASGFWAFAVPAAIILHRRRLPPGHDRSGEYRHATDRAV